MLAFYREFTHDCPDELTVYGALLTGPDGHPAVGLALCYAGDLVEGERIITPLRRFGPPLADLIRPMGLYELHTLLDAATPRGRRYFGKASAVTALSDEAIEAIVAAGEQRTSPFSTVLIQHLHGAATRVDPAATAFGARDETFYVDAIAAWETGDSAPHVEWSRALGRDLAPFSRRGVYVNFLGSEGEERIRASYGAGYERLAALKRRYDPENFFHLNQNIKPSPERRLS